MTKVIESVAFEKSQTCAQTYLDICRVLIAFVQEAFNRNISIARGLQEFILGAPKETSSWREYGASVIGAMLNLQNDISIGETTEGIESSDSPADCQLSWQSVRNDARTLMLVDLLPPVITTLT